MVGTCALGAHVRRNTNASGVLIIATRLELTRTRRTARCILSNLRPHDKYALARHTSVFIHFAVSYWLVIAWSRNCTVRRITSVYAIAALIFRSHFGRTVETRARIECLRGTHGHGVAATWNPIASLPTLRHRRKSSSRVTTCHTHFAVNSVSSSKLELVRTCYLWIC